MNAERETSLITIHRSAFIVALSHSRRSRPDLLGCVQTRKGVTQA